MTPQNDEPTVDELAAEESTETTVEQAPVDHAEDYAESTSADNSADSDEAVKSPDLQAENARLLEENKQLNEQMLRVQADMQNVRRRAQLDVEKAHKFGLEKMAKELLSVVDNLERALAAAGEDDATQALREGVELTLNEFLKTLEKFSIVVLNPEGEPFNPEQHQAISMIENEEVEPNSVIAVMQKGYSLNGRLLRPAMVMVSKPAPTVDAKA